MYNIFVQNNSGGYLIGPAYIIIEADTDNEAAQIFHDLNLNYSYCDCCGFRWDGIYYSDETLHIFDTKLPSEKYKEVTMDYIHQYDTDDNTYLLIGNKL